MRFACLGAAALLAFAATPASAQAHRCANDAKAKALKLLKFASDGDDRASVDGASVKSIGTIKTLSGDKRYDVLQVDGAIYKATYRMRLIYMQLPGDCALIGQEIIQYGDPY